MQSPESFILQEIISPGRQFFTNQLLQQANNKKLDKRKRGGKFQQNSAMSNAKVSYSIFNLVKVPQLTLSNSQILAGQLLKTNVLNQKRLINQRGEEMIKYYEDFQQSQRINKKFTKMFIKPIKAKSQEVAKQASLVSFKQAFHNISKVLIDQMGAQIIGDIEEKYHPKPKLTTTKNMLELGQNKMLYFVSDAQDLCKKVIFQKQMNEFSSDFFNKVIENFKHQLRSIETIQNPHLFQKFTSNFQTLLPYYLQSSYHQNFSPVPWKNGALQKEIQKSKFPLITGKVLYKYEHNLILLKENKIKLKIFQHGMKRYEKLRDFIEEKISEKRINNHNKKEKQIFNENEQKQQNLREIQKSQLKNSRYFSIDNNDYDEVNLDPENSKQKDFISKNLIKGFQQQKRGQLTYQPTIKTVQSQNSVNHCPLNNKNPLQINLWNNQSKNRQNLNELNLDQLKFSKNSYFAQHQYQILKQDQLQNTQISKNPFLYNQSRVINSIEIEMNLNHFQVQNAKVKRDKMPFEKVLPFQKVKNSNWQNNRSKSLKSPSDSNSSDCWNQIRRFQQGKTTKKKKSFMVKKGERTSENSFMKMIKSQNKKLFSKKSSGIQFYPLKLGNLILQQNHNAYLEYNCQKQQPKHLSMKFLVDRKKHGTNKVQLVIPTLHEHNQMKLKDQQRAKQIMKIIIQLSGQISRIKQQSSYDEQAHKGCMKISSQLQIYKFYYQELTYFEIIDSLNIEKEWMENQIENSNANGWKY